MEKSDPDKQTLELIRKTEQALALRQAETEKKARAVINAARTQAERIIREKEEELAQARRMAQSHAPMDWPPIKTVREEDKPNPQAAEIIARGLFGKLIAGGAKRAVEIK